MGDRFVALAAAVAVALSIACGSSPSTLDRDYASAQEQMRRGRIDDALTAAAEGATRAERGGDELRTWRFRLLVADAELSLGNLPAARRWLDQPVPARAELDSVRGRQLHLQARSKVAQGQLAAAPPLIAAAKPLAANDPALLADVELLESQVLYRTGRAADADTLLGATLNRVSGEGDPYRLAQVSIATGMGLVTRGRYDEALPHFERIVENRGLEGTTVQALAFNNAGLCHARLGQFDRAIALQQRAVASQESGRRQSLAQALGELGSTYLLREDYGRSVEYLRRAFGIANDAGLASDAALFARNLSAAYVALEQWDDAAHYNQEAARFAQSAGGPSPYSTVNEGRIAAGRGRADEATRLFQQAISDPKATPGVRWMAHEGLARLALAGGQPAEAAREFEAALAIVEQTRSSLLRADDRISFTSRLVAFYRGYTELLLSQGQAERALEVADASRARVLAERQGVAAPAVRASAAALKRLAAQTNAAFVFYALGAERSWVWTVTGREIRARPVPPSSVIEPLVAEHQAAIQNALADPLSSANQPGDRLYASLIEPIAASVASAASVVIVPDGALHRLNFETVPVPDRRSGDGSASAPRHYWIDDVTVQIAPSLAMLQAGSRLAAAPSLLLVGNAAPHLPEFPALSYAAAEMDGVRSHFPAASVTVVAGERASPAGFRAAKPDGFSIIHFTSHAVANLESPLDSAVILSGPDQGFKLYARDVAALPLRTELVTVSACRSAGERTYAGEGLIGFAWAFLRAGSRRVVAGSWDVDDRSTATLMDDLYARLAAGAPPAVALREAKRALIKNGYPNPYYWAPLQLFTVVI